MAPIHLTLVHFLHLLALVAAISSTTFPPRACKTIAPSLISSLFSNDPNSSYPNSLSTIPGGSSPLVLKTSYYKQPSDYRQLQFFSFPIPTNATTCTVGITDSAGTLYQGINGTLSDVNPLKVDFVHLAPNAFRYAPTYIAALNASTNSSGASLYSPLKLHRGQSQVLGSELCPQPRMGLQVEHLQFIMKLVEVPIGYEDWAMAQQTPDAAGLVKINGLYLAVDC